MTTNTPQIFLQYPIFTRFILPFLLVFTLVFAILEKTKVLGDGKKQLDAVVSFIIGLIFITVLSPTLILSNLVLFLSISLVVVFIILLIWGFLSGEGKLEILTSKPGSKWVLFILVAIAVIFGVFWAFGIPPPSTSGSLIDALFRQSWSSNFWTNVIFGVLIAAALALVIGRKATPSK